MTKRAARLAAVVVVVLVGLGATIAAVVRSRGLPYAASYFFSEDAFANVKAGMSAEQVRDLIGPPLDRREHQPGQHWWKYSEMPDGPWDGAGDPPRWMELVVRLDAAGHVLGTNRIKSGHSMRDPETGHYVVLGTRPPARPQPLGELPLQVIQGEPLRLGPGGRRYVVQVMASWCRPCTKQRPRVEAMLPGTGDNPLELVLVSIDEDEQALRRYITEHQITATVLWAPTMEVPGFLRDKGIPQYALLQDGHIGWFDFPFEIPGDERLADLDWFIRRADLGHYVAK